jgi:hypothetical protein
MAWNDRSKWTEVWQHSRLQLSIVFYFCLLCNSSLRSIRDPIALKIFPSSVIDESYSIAIVASYQTYQTAGTP